MNQSFTLVYSCSLCCYYLIIYYSMYSDSYHINESIITNIHNDENVLSKAINLDFPKL